jgi:hypothetical protein
MNFNLPVTIFTRKMKPLESTMVFNCLFHVGMDLGEASIGHGPPSIPKKKKR